MTFRLPATAMLLVMLACERNAPPSPTPPPSATKRPSPPARMDGLEVLGPPAGRPAPGADERDAPNTPAALPRSYDIAGWVKYEPVRVVQADELASLISDETMRAVMESYELKSAAHCVYRYVPYEEAPPLLLDVLWVETRDADGAFGLFTVLAAPPRGLNADGSQTADSKDSDGTLRLFGWQGAVCALMTVVDDDDRGTLAAAARLLRAKLLFAVPRADPPALLRLMPRENLLPEREWLIRDPVATQLPGTTELPPVDTEALEDALGLDGGAVLAIAAYEVGAGESPNYVWVAQYADRAAAAEAFERYQARLEQPKDDVDRNTLLAGAQGRFIAGTWTADQESVQHVLPRLLTSLPREPD